MKKLAVRTMMLLVVLLAGSLAAYAGNGNGTGMENGTCVGGTGEGSCLAGTCTGPLISCPGTVETITGVVAGYGVPGNGMVVATETATETLYGVGPVWLWERYGMDRPEIGETITAEVETVTIRDRTMKVIISLTLDGQTIQLRDRSTCMPVWRAGR